MRSHVKAVLCGLFLLVFTQLSLAANGKFPIGPDAKITPGSVCSNPDSVRYPEHIKYCERNVDSQLKRSIFAEYDKTLGYSMRTMNRMDFKIDHYIPLCAGGSNDRINLWPQHKSVYDITDPMEPLICGKMSEGRLAQAKAIELIKTGKNDLNKVPEILKYLESL